MSSRKAAKADWRAHGDRLPRFQRVHALVTALLLGCHTQGHLAIAFERHDKLLFEGAFDKIHVLCRDKPEIIQVSGNWVIYERWSYQKGETLKELSVVPLTGGEVFVLDRLPDMMGHTPPRYAIGAPWIIWAESGQAPGLKLYNLETGEKRTSTPPDCRQDDFLGQPSHFLIPETMVLFQGCYQGLGYSIPEGEFFSVPLNEGAETSGLVGWAFSRDRLVWVHMPDGPGPRQTNIYSATVTRTK